MQGQNTAQQKELADAVDDLIDPVGRGGSAAPGREIAHSQAAQESQNKQDDSALFFQPDRENTQSGEHGAQTHNHHGNENEADCAPAGSGHGT